MIAYSQRDNRWRAAKLGTGSLTIGQAGCLLTCASSVLSAFGTDLKPFALNAELIARQGFYQGNLLIFAALRAWDAAPTSIVDCRKVPAPIDLITAARGKGDQVIVMVDFGPGGEVQPHWVCVVDPEVTVVMDPWQLPGGEFVSLARYLAPGWDAARGILRVVIYSRRQAAPTRFLGAEVVEGMEHQDTVHLRRRTAVLDSR